MLIYEVNLTIDPGAASKFEEWLPGHIRELLDIDGFVRAEWFDLGPDPDGRPQWSVHYHLASQAHLDAYLEHHAERMRGDGIARFGGQLTATRRVLNHRASFGDPD